MKKPAPKAARKGKPGPKPKAKVAKVKKAPKAVAAKRKAKEDGKVKAAMATLKRLNPKAWSKPRTAGKAKATKPRAARKPQQKDEPLVLTPEDKALVKALHQDVTPQPPPPTVIKKVIQGADSKALKILVDGVKHNFLEAEKWFAHRLEKCPPEIQERARRLISDLGATPITAMSLAIRVAELEQEKHGPKKSRGGRGKGAYVEGTITELGGNSTLPDHHGDAESMLGLDIADEASGLPASA